MVVSCSITSLHTTLMNLHLQLSRPFALQAKFIDGPRNFLPPTDCYRCFLSTQSLFRDLQEFPATSALIFPSYRF